MGTVGDGAVEPSLQILPEGHLNVWRKVKTLAGMNMHQRQRQLFWKRCSYCTRPSCLSWQWARNQPVPHQVPADVLSCCPRDAPVHWWWMPHKKQSGPHQPALVTPPGGVRGRSCRTAWELSVATTAKIDHGRGGREAQSPNPLTSLDNFPAERSSRGPNEGARCAVLGEAALH